MKQCNQLCPWNTLYGCHKPENEPCILSNMPCEKFEQKQMTNADHIRSMTDEELGAFLSKPWCENHRTKTECAKFDTDCNACVLDWLKRPCEEDT